MSSTALPPQTIRWPVPGELIVHGKNQYRIGEVLGRGSYGVTFAGADQWENQLVIKVLIPQGQTYGQVRRNWEREITTLFRLRHPNITFVYDAFELANTFHIVMERCGGSLTSLFTLEEYNGDDWWRPIARCMLQGIGYMHDNGYVHKDIHLRNVFWAYVRNELMPGIGPAVTFKIGDLGIARMEFEVRTARPTVPWMAAPEVLDPGRCGAVGKPTDIYHAALVLLAVAMGIEPSYNVAEILAGAPRAAAEHLPAPFGPAIGRALTVRVEERTPTAYDFWLDLNGLRT
jgi:serine/threonine-protein kinase